MNIHKRNNTKTQ